MDTERVNPLSGTDDPNCVSNGEKELGQEASSTLTTKRRISEAKDAQDTWAVAENVSMAKETSRRLLEGIQTLQLDLPPWLATKVGTNYNGMTPKARFKSETLGGLEVANDKGGVSGDDAVEDSICFSCQATIGADSNEGGHMRSESSS